MDEKAMFDGLVSYACILIMVTLHEFGHAWAADRCGDDTPRLQGRVTLNPIAHIDLIGTILLPLLAVFLASTGSRLSGFIIGWGKPVQVDTRKLRHPVRDDVLVTMAGPAMNIVLAVAAMALARLGSAVGFGGLTDSMYRLAQISMYLFFFNLLPIPPLDGSRILRLIVGMGEERYWRIARFGFLILILAIQVPFVRAFLAHATMSSLDLMVMLYRF